MKLRFTIALWLAMGACDRADETDAGQTQPGGVMHSAGVAAAPRAGAGRGSAAAPSTSGSGPTGAAARVPAVPAAGYQRFEPPPIEVNAGDSQDWAQWVGGPLDQDYDVADITGAQSAGGHHALLYATTEAQPAGFTRVWQDADQLRTRLMGGVGGEGGANVTLPPGVVFRVKKGSYLLVQTHYLNATDKPIQGSTVLDVKLIPVDPAHRLASIMASTNNSVTIAPSIESTLTVTCPVQQDLHFIRIANHMHEYGASVTTEVIDASGQARELKADALWDYSWALNPNFTLFPVEDPLVVRAGSTLRTRCTWHNTTDRSIAFPTEMCVFFGFILNDVDIYCTAGRWSSMREDSSTPATPGVAGSGAPAPAPGGAGSAAPPPQGACLEAADRTILQAPAFEQQSTQCATPCALDPNVSDCTARCLVAEVGLSPGCAACNGGRVACTARSCLTQCVADSASADCRMCIAQKCAPEYTRCAGP